MKYLATYWAVDGAWSESFEFATFDSAFLYLQKNVKDNKGYKLAEINKFDGKSEPLVLQMRTIQ